MFSRETDNNPPCFRCWPTEWTCPTVRWAVYCAAALRRRCSPASWSVTQTCTRLPASICFTTPSITSSWLPLSWSVNYFIHAQERHSWSLSKKRKRKEKMERWSSRCVCSSDASRSCLSKLRWGCFNWAESEKPRSRNKRKLTNKINRRRKKYVNTSFNFL